MIWTGPTGQCKRDAENYEGGETERKAIVDARRATFVEDALADATSGVSRPLFIVKEDGAIRPLQIGLISTGQERTVCAVHHDPDLEMSLDLLAKGGAEFIAPGRRGFENDPDLVLAPLKTRWPALRDKPSELYGLKASHRFLVLERFLKDLASYDGDDFLGDGARALRMRSSVFERNGKIQSTHDPGNLRGKPRYNVKEELKALDRARFQARLLGHNSTVRHWMTSQALEPPVTGLKWYAKNIVQAKAVCADVNASADERRVARAILDDDAETRRAREVRDLDPDAAMEDGYADAKQLQAHAAFLRSLEPGGEEAAPAAPPSFRLDRRRWRLPRGEREWSEDGKQKDIDWEALKEKALQVPTPPAPWWSPEDVEGLEPDDEKDDSGDELDDDVGQSFF